MSAAQKKKRICYEKKNIESSSIKKYMKKTLPVETGAVRWRSGGVEKREMAGGGFNDVIL